MRTFRMAAGFRRGLVVGGRVVAYASVLSFGLAWCWVERVSAQIEQSSLALGERLAQSLGDVVGEPQALVVNGQNVWIASQTTPLSVAEALDRFDARCVSSSQALSADLDGLEAAPLAPSGPGPALAGQRWLIRRDERVGQGGQLVCLAPTEPLTGFLDLGERLSTFFATGELGVIGELRYVRAKPRAEGGSHVIAVWSAGAFNLLEALPHEADVPGEDPDGAPRPPEATRLLSARVPGRGFAVYSYTSNRSAAELLRFYALEMSLKGWAELEAERFVPETEALSKQARAYLMGDALTLVVVDDAADAAPAQAVATLVQARALGVARAIAPAVAE
jgi:hypothetical protein